MADKKSTFTKLGIPASFSGLLLILTFAFLLAPYLAGADFSVLKVPQLSAAAQHLLKFTGPVLFVLALALCYPFWVERVTSARSAGTQEAINVVFENATKAYVNVTWLDFEGKRDPKLVYSIAPGDTQEVATFVAHAWVISNANTGAELKSVIISENNPRIVIR